MYKAADLTSRLVKSGANVKVIMTRNACRLMSARIFQTLSKTKSILRCGGCGGLASRTYIACGVRGFASCRPATANVIGCFASESPMTCLQLFFWLPARF
ncbi:MAG: hypothetical protein ACLUKN_09430 [Bacilli bacterium]